MIILRLEAFNLAWAQSMWRMDHYLSPSFCSKVFFVFASLTSLRFDVAFQRCPARSFDSSQSLVCHMTENKASRTHLLHNSSFICDCFRRFVEFMRSCFIDRF